MAYWSLDPSGVDRLSDGVAADLGFPAIQLQMWVGTKSWDTSVYDGILQLHQAKGFDPYSQEVAIELGWPLLHVYCDRETLSTHMLKNDAGGCDLDSAAAFHMREGSESGDEAYGIRPAPVSEQSLSSGNQCCAPEEAELLAPSRSFNIVIAVQFVLIFTATALSLYDQC
ncbi:hypothetical protein B0H13DRAFT_2345435 [Mycena leptocephala]|nr:hypothetical protein B0H13DRAFT_2345435 [Mycena leptocephala]